MLRKASYTNEYRKKDKTIIKKGLDIDVQAFLQ